MKNKNLLYICDYGAAYTGNFIACLAALAQAVQKRNAGVWFLFPEGARNHHWVKNLPVDGDHVCFCDFSVKGLAAKCRELSVHLQDSNTIVHTHFVADFHLMAVRMAFSNVICHYHMMVPIGYTLMKKIKRLVRLCIYRKMVLVGVSQAVTDDMERYFWKPVCECIPNAVDFAMLEKCSEGTSLPEGYRGKGRFRILAHGSSFYGKGADMAVRAVADLNREEPGAFELFITSNDVAAAQSFAEKLAPGAPYVKAASTVENIKRIYDSVDLFVSPSREEAFGYAVVEASASGCQVAASDIPGQNTLKGIPGVHWFELDNVDALKDVILRARELVRSGEAPQIKKVQSAYVRTHYGVEEWVKRNLNLYEQYFGLK